MTKNFKRKRPTDDDYDDSPLTADELSRLRPAREVCPELVAAYEAGTLRMPGRPVGSHKTAVSIRIDNDVLAFFKSKGAGWQTRMSNALKTIMEVAQGSVAT